jgi:glycosyltransferase involved in cell wall biosynthesis
MNAVYPLVSIGMPVYNGEKYLAAALDSILSQTYPRLEIIISDNASTDATRLICEAYAAKDSRVRYYRNASNLGAARNYNLTVEYASGKYFKWAAYDDVCKPRFIERCVEILERDPDVAVAYPKTTIIDEHSTVINDVFEDRFDFREREPHHRYKAFTKAPLDCHPVFGVIRLSVLRQTPCIGPYESSDRVLLGELALHGKIVEIPERLFLRRFHTNISTYSCATKDAIAKWFDPAASGSFSRLRRFVEYVRSLNRAPLSPYQRMYCLFYLIRFYVKLYLEPARWHRVLRGCVPTLGSLPSLGPRFTLDVPRKGVR